MTSWQSHISVTGSLLSEELMILSSNTIQTTLASKLLFFESFHFLHCYSPYLYCSTGSTECFSLPQTCPKPTTRLWQHLLLFHDLHSN